MASSVVAAFLEKYDGLDASLFPGSARFPRYFTVPLVASGVQVRPPYCVLFDDSATPEPIESGRQMHTCRLRWEVYAEQLADADGAAAVICWNGDTNQQGLGFDYGTLPAVDGFGFNTMRLVRTQRAAEPRPGQAGGLVHKVTLLFEAELKRL